MTTLQWLVVGVAMAIAFLLGLGLGEDREAKNTERWKGFALEQARLRSRAENALAMQEHATENTAARIAEQTAQINAGFSGEVTHLWADEERNEQLKSEAVLLRI